jgi:hypothetical protein
MVIGEGVFGVYREAITDISHGTYHCFKFRAEFRSKAPDVDVYGTSTSEVVITPNLLQEL